MKLPGIRGSLTSWSLGALAAGFLLGALGNGRDVPVLAALAAGLRPIGSLWLAALQMTVLPFVIAQMLAAVAGTRGVASVGRLTGRALAEIREVAGVEYGRIDYAVVDGRVQTWEINLVPTIGRGRSPSSTPKPPAVETIRRQTKARFYAAFRAAWEAVDSGPEGPAIELGIDPALARAAWVEANGTPRPAGTFARLLAPARPVLEPMAAPFLPLFGRLARRAGSERR